jgi:hypothetical protein
MVEYQSKYICNICFDNVLESDSDSDCIGPRHLTYVEVDEAPMEEIQERKFGIYVDPVTGKIVKAKALNNPLILG